MRRIAIVVAGIGLAAAITGGAAVADPTDTSVPGAAPAGAPLTLSPTPTTAPAGGTPAPAGTAVPGAPVTSQAAATANAAATPASATSADYAAGKAAVLAKDWTTAIAKLRAAVAFDPANADIHNFLGYSYRKAGDLPSAMKYYGEALRLNPKHKGALEYQGEAYLQLFQPAPAKSNLAKLKAICGIKCEEYKDLNKAIAAYKPPKTKKK